MLKRNRLMVLFISAALSVGTLSACEETDSDIGAQKQPAETTENDAAVPEPDDPPEPEGEEDAEELAPDDGDEVDNSATDGNEVGASAADSDDGDATTQTNYDALPTTVCPIDVPAPMAPHALDSEEPGDGDQIYCLAHVAAKGDPVHLYEDVTEQFKGIGAEQLENNPDPDPREPGSLSIQSWQVDVDHEVIVNITAVSLTQNELVYVVRSPQR